MDTCYSRLPSSLILLGAHPSVHVKRMRLKLLLIADMGMRPKPGRSMHCPLMGLDPQSRDPSQSPRGSSLTSGDHSLSPWGFRRKQKPELIAATLSPRGESVPYRGHGTGQSPDDKARVQPSLKPGRPGNFRLLSPQLFLLFLKLL